MHFVHFYTLWEFDMSLFLSSVCSIFPASLSEKIILSVVRAVNTFVKDQLPTDTLFTYRLLILFHLFMWFVYAYNVLF